MAQDLQSRRAAGDGRKVEAFALLSGLTALFVRNETAASDAGVRHRAGYRRHVAAVGNHPRVSALLAAPPAGGDPRDQRDRFDTVLVRALTGVLG
ncbi:hypothetical protein [Streptomyces sp. CBMA123]|uniref:hypothetical protein n=1 Tax=Streptomyces sp. CBMA123 TaxID=1896313 RepID=UPI00166206D8|nr:hypothetical protein [Streptomyces sp. CBMA123]MBD0693229.1 hypothetical protein [Streptomyces sp. CBMA123]